MLEVVGLTCAYGDIVAVDRISFTVRAGEIFGLIGANGAGKTSTIMSLAGLVPTRSGEVRLNDIDVSATPPHRRVRHGIALVPEGRRVFADLSVTENLTVGATRLPKTAMEVNRQRIFDTFPRLAERRHQLAGSLSGGEQQMLAIGRAVMAAPQVLLVDEISLGLMPTAIEDCYRVLKELQQDGIAILLVEQSTERILHAADHVAVLDSGKIVWTGTGEAAIGNANLVDAYLGMANA